jgi:hypothetical protein
MDIVSIILQLIIIGLLIVAIIKIDNRRDIKRNILGMPVKAQVVKREDELEKLIKDITHD